MSVTEEQDPKGPSGVLMSALTTEHFTLQSARSATILESNGRSQMFLSAATGVTVAPALIAELDGLHRTFTAFSLSLLPALLAFGLMTYVRLADLTVHDATCARAIGQIRAFYRTLGPEAQQYVMLPVGHGQHAVMNPAGHGQSRWHQLSHASTAIAALTSVVAGTFYALVAHLGKTASPPVLGIGAGLIAVLVFAVLTWDQQRRWRRAHDLLPTMFGPNGEAASDQQQGCCTQASGTYSGGPAAMNSQVPASFGRPPMPQPRGPFGRVDKKSRILRRPR